jgi:hypothetical protein
MTRDPRAVLVTDRDVSHLLEARTVLRAAMAAADAEATRDHALRVPTAREETITTMFSVEIAGVKEADREVVRETAKGPAAREVVKDMTTMIDLITIKRVEDLRLLVVVPGTTTTMMTIDHAKDTTIKIMTIPAKIELVEATKTMLAVDNPVNKIIKTIMITNLVTITEDPGETTTIKTIV